MYKRIRNNELDVFFQAIDKNKEGKFEKRLSKKIKRKIKVIENIKEQKRGE